MIKTLEGRLFTINDDWSFKTIFWLQNTPDKLYNIVFMSNSIIDSREDFNLFDFVSQVIKNYHSHH